MKIFKSLCGIALSFFAALSLTSSIAFADSALSRLATKEQRRQELSTALGDAYTGKISEKELFERFPEAKDLGISAKRGAVGIFTSHPIGQSQSLFKIEATPLSVTEIKNRTALVTLAEMRRQFKELDSGDGSQNSEIKRRKAEGPGSENGGGDPIDMKSFIKEIITDAGNESGQLGPEVSERSKKSVASPEEEFRSISSAAPVGTQAR